MTLSTQLMGILNITPNSFSEGNNLVTPRQFYFKAKKMLQHQATILDLGAEPSGPTSKTVPLSQELARIKTYLPVLSQLQTKFNFQISIDTYKSQIADFALSNHKIDFINDITALRQDPKMIDILKQHPHCKIILMYSKDSSPRTTNSPQSYRNIIQTLKQFFTERLNFLKSHNIAPSRIILDPGMGAFISSNPQYSYQILNRLPELKTHFNLPILIGTSRKSMHPFPLQDRLIPSITTALHAAHHGADILRVHDIKEHQLALTTLKLLQSNQ